MSIELKYEFKYRSLVALLAIASFFFGALGIVYGVAGLIIMPITSAFLSALMCVEKRRVTSSLISLFLIVGELLVGFGDYFTVTSLSSALVALIIAYHYSKGKQKSDGVIFATALVALSIFATFALYVIGTTDATSLSEIYKYFLSAFTEFKKSTISSVISMSSEAVKNSASLSAELLNEMFDAYLNCIVAIVTILAFAIVGVTHKIFSGVVRKCSKDPDTLNGWRFLPNAVFAYFYFAVAILSMFATDASNALSVSIANLYLIFMFVFAYIGFVFITAMLTKRGRSRFFSTLLVLALTVALSSFAIQILAVVGAFVTINVAKINNNDQKDDHISIR